MAPARAVAGGGGNMGGEIRVVDAAGAIMPSAAGLLAALLRPQAAPLLTTHAEPNAAPAAVMGREALLGVPCGAERPRGGRIGGDTLLDRGIASMAVARPGGVEGFGERGGDEGEGREEAGGRGGGEGSEAVVWHVSEGRIAPGKIVCPRLFARCCCTHAPPLPPAKPPLLQFAPPVPPLVSPAISSPLSPHPCLPEPLTITLPATPLAISLQAPLLASLSQPVPCHACPLAPLLKWPHRPAARPSHQRDHPVFRLPGVACPRCPASALFESTQKASQEAPPPCRSPHPPARPPRLSSPRRPALPALAASPSSHDHLFFPPTLAPTDGVGGEGTAGKGAGEEGAAGEGGPREDVRVRVRGSAVDLASMGGLFLRERVSWGQEWVDQLRADTWMHAFSFTGAQQQEAGRERQGWDSNVDGGAVQEGKSAVGATNRGGTDDGAADVFQVLLDASHGTAEVLVELPVRAHAGAQPRWVLVKLLLTVADQASNRLHIRVPAAFNSSVKLC
ncbi:unnamed protein product [Closterium sp. Naga37s-1]|nr:unnamed protein product [Closterium sp. Naga37s-1]